MQQDKFEDFLITPEIRIREVDFAGLDGVLDKFWIDHSQLGKSLVKIDKKNYAESWSEKVTAELSSKLGIPYARYELGTLNGFEDYKDGTHVIISPNFELENHSYGQGLNLLNEIVPEFDYTIAEVFKVLEIANIQLPLNYQAPEGIKDGVDLFVGYLVLDSLIDNFDRHQGNWGYSTSQDGIKRLAPTYDHGVSMGAILDSHDLKTINISRYNTVSKSAFGIKHKTVIEQTAKLRPLATEIWLEQLSKINHEQVKTAFERLPSDRITPEASQFAQELIKFNQADLLTLQRKLTPTKNVYPKANQEQSSFPLPELSPLQMESRQNYLNAKQEVLKSNLPAQHDNFALDVEIAKYLKSKSWSTSDITGTLTQSDYAYNLFQQNPHDNYSHRIAKYIYSVGQKADLTFENHHEKIYQQRKSEPEIEL